MGALFTLVCTIYHSFDWNSLILSSSNQVIACPWARHWTHIFPPSVSLGVWMHGNPISKACLQTVLYEFVCKREVVMNTVKVLWVVPQTIKALYKSKSILHQKLLQPLTEWVVFGIAIYMWLAFNLFCAKLLLKSKWIIIWCMWVPWY